MNSPHIIAASHQSRQRTEDDDDDDDMNVRERTWFYSDADADGDDRRVGLDLDASILHLKQIWSQSLLHSG